MFAVVVIMIGLSRANDLCVSIFNDHVSQCLAVLHLVNSGVPEALLREGQLFNNFKIHQILSLNTHIVTNV